MLKTSYKVTSVEEEDKCELVVVAENYSDAVEKLEAMADFEYLFGAGFNIVPAGDVLV